MTDTKQGFFGVESVSITNDNLVVGYIIRPGGDKVIRRVTTEFLFGHQLDPELSEIVGRLSDILKQKAVDTFTDLKNDPNPTPLPIATL